MNIYDKKWKTKLTLCSQSKKIELIVGYILTILKNKLSIKEWGSILIIEVLILGFFLLICLSIKRKAVINHFRQSDSIFIIVKKKFEGRVLFPVLIIEAASNLLFCFTPIFTIRIWKSAVPMRLEDKFYITHSADFISER